MNQVKNKIYYEQTIHRKTFTIEKKPESAIAYDLVISDLIPEECLLKALHCKKFELAF